MSTIQVVEKNIVIQHPQLDEPLTVKVELEVSLTDCVCAPAATQSLGNPVGWQAKGEAALA